ncbi:MBL fold metallo-hydrolase [bacterium DOLZORAL124_64_63]|nr:MAG: MBL fold metallo-hydrolase [bacterium DOLZORAL124_64_63]
MGDKVLLVDCGFSHRQIKLRLAEAKLERYTVCGILLTHEHTDHIRGADRAARQFGVPLLGTQGTLRAAGLTGLDHRVVRHAQQVEHAGFGITPLDVPHDSAEPCAYLVEAAGRRVLLATDMGTPEGLVSGLVTDLDYLYIEANHDADMLRAGPYPWFLKKRIAGAGGHINNRECGELVAELARRSPRLQAVMLAHLSEKNNDPGLAKAVVRETAGKVLGEAVLVVGRQHVVTDMPVAPWCCSP